MKVGGDRRAWYESAVRAPTFRSRLIRALRDARTELASRIEGERLYAFALYTSGESDFDYVCASAQTEEALRRQVDSLALRSPSEGDRATLEHSLRWSAPDWAWHDFSSAVAELELPPSGEGARDARTYADFVAALRALDQEGLFGEGEARNEVALLVLCGDMSDDFFLRGMKKLNPPEVVRRYLDEHTPEPLHRRLDALPAPERRRAYVSLYVDLALGRDSALAAEARRRHLTYFGSLADKLREQDADVLDDLLAIVETHGFGPTFNERGTPEFERVGVFAAAQQLATAAALLIRSFGLRSELDVRRLQAVLRRRMDMDADVEGPVSTLPANVARVLHELRPTRFPKQRMSSHTNRLENPEPFLEAPRA